MSHGYMEQPRRSDPSRVIGQPQHVTPKPVALIQASDSVRALPSGNLMVSTNKQITMSPTSSEPLRVPQRLQHSTAASTSQLSTTTFHTEVGAPPRTVNATPIPVSMSTPTLSRHSAGAAADHQTTTFPNYQYPTASGPSRRDSTDAASRSSLPPKHQQRYSLGGNTELLETARRQQKQIEAGIAEIEDRRRLVEAQRRSSQHSAQPPVSEQLRNLRTTITRDEQELAQLAVAQRNAREAANFNRVQRATLQSLEATYSRDDEDLRNAVEKVGFLRKQLELLYLRRASAANMAIAHQRRLNVQGGNLARAGNSSSMTQQQRPQASVGPFQIQNLQHLKDSSQGKPLTSGADFGVRKNSAPEPLGQPTSSYSGGLPIVEEGAQRFVRGKADQLSLRSDTLKAAKRRSWAQASDPAQESEKIWRILSEEQKKGRTHISFANDLLASRASASSDRIRLRNSPYESLPTHSEQVRPRPKPIIEAGAPTAVPEKLSSSECSPATSTSSTVSNASKENVEASSARTGHTATTHMNTQSESSLAISSTVVEMLASEEENEGQSVKMFDSELETVSATISQSTKASEEGDSELAEQDDEELLEPELHLAAQRELSPSVEEGGSCTDEMSSASGGEEPMFEESSLATPDGSQVKGILRMSDKAKHNKRIVFDPLVLFLDGALEGELETVVENSSKITDVSMPNDEGITALHNAICAGHHEIVTYLVDNHADVNAADSDGWTPLHCAASCNNLPMVKLLVENGACVFATTLSDSETPARKCEEGEDGYESCAQYLEMADKCAGIVNEKMVYAGYDYDADREDELSLEEGDALRVIERDGNEKLWWLCEKLSSGAQGFAPRNYLCLYPTWRHRERNNFKHFELPKLPASASPLKRSLSNDDIPRSKEQKTDVWDSGHNVLAQA